MLLRDIMAHLESLAPISLQESYDNSGLLVGSPSWRVNAALICLDCTPEIVEEAKAKGCNLIIAHHPIVFSGLKKINGKNYVERTIIAAIKNDIAIYAIHTNLDNVKNGVNQKICEKLGLVNTKILAPKKELLFKLAVFVPKTHVEIVKNVIFETGAGQIGKYDECSFSMPGEGSFRATEEATPFVGQIGKRHSEEEIRIEVILPKWLTNRTITAIKTVHPYEEVAYDIYALENEYTMVGSGMIGELPTPVPPLDFLKRIKQEMEADGVRYTAFHKDEIKTVAVCGGSGSFLLGNALAVGADLFVTADFKYHQFFDADNRIIIADIGHYESEQFTIELISDWMGKKFATFATHLAETVTNPVRYL